MDISMELIKSLRDKTGAGIGDCKKALEEASGDLEKAIEVLRKKGIAKAAKRGDREACEGMIVVEGKEDGSEGYILEINAETDFVVRNDKFQDIANKIFSIIKEKKPASLDDLLAMPMDAGTVKEELESLSGVIGEKIDVKRFEILSSAGSVAAYSHAGGRIGVLVSLDKAGSVDLARDIAMHIAAVNPKYISSEEVPSDEINKEKDIYSEQLRKEGKPEEMIEKILGGKINKYFEEVCLLKQEYIKDDKKKVEDVLGGAKVEKFLRFSL